MSMVSRIHLDDEPQRILLIKPSSLGDIVHTLPVLHQLRRTFPKTRIDWLAAPANAGLLQGHPEIDEIVLFDRHSFAQAWWNPAKLAQLIAFGLDLEARGYDVVIDLQGLLRSGLITAATRARVRVGLANAREGAVAFYTHAVDAVAPREVPSPTGESCATGGSPASVRARTSLALAGKPPVAPRHASVAHGDVRPASVEMHAVDRNMSVAEALGCGGDVRFDLALTDAERGRAVAMLHEHGVDGRYAVLLPGAHWETKRWDIGGFASLAGLLRDECGVTPVVCGGPAEMEPASVIGAANLVGKTSLRELAAVLDRASVVIANDSGPMHIAAALGTPLVTAYGPTSPIRTGPYRRPASVVRLDYPCAPCFKRRCTHQSCMRELTVEAVMQRVQRTLSN